MNFRLLMKQRSPLILVKSFHTLIKLTLDGGKDLGLMVSCQENVKKGKGILYPPLLNPRPAS